MIDLFLLHCIVGHRQKEENNLSSIFEFQFDFFSAMDEQIRTGGINWSKKIKKVSYTKEKDSLVTTWL